ncbi:MAG: hypothetical protein MZV70_45735 [Desulfobacterales bacterium]|nr:hypothetical protein [Desulfobacterales bacterium]
MEVQTKKGSADDLMDLNINVKEKPTGSFTMGAGYSGYEGAYGDHAGRPKQPLRNRPKAGRPSLRISSIDHSTTISGITEPRVERHS